MSRSPNFRYAPPQKLKINLIFRRIRFCCRRILPVLLSPHLLILVNIIFSLFRHHGGIMRPGVFLCVNVKISLNSLDNTVCTSFDTSCKTKTKNIEIKCLSSAATKNRMIISIYFMISPRGIMIVSSILIYQNNDKDKIF